MLLSYSSVALLLGFLVSCAIVGRSASQLLPFRWRSFGSFYFGPALGAAIFLLISTLVAWTFGHYSSWIVRTIHCLVVVVAFYLQPDRRRLGSYLGLLCLFAAFASWPMFVQLWRFGAFSVGIDQFTYLSHAQWLQSHSFRDIPSTDFHPLWTQVLLYQTLSLRMGASFLFGWVQGVAGMEWAHEVYPPFMAFAATAAGLTLAGGIAVLTGVNRRIALLLGLCLPLTLNGFAFGTVAGFLPQTYGVLLAFLGLLLLGLALKSATAQKDGARMRAGAACLAGVSLAASIHAYPEMAPFSGSACAIACLYSFLGSPRRRRAVMLTSGVTVLLTVLLVNLQWFRAYRSIRDGAGVIAGWPVRWRLFEFWSHTAGWHAGSGDGDGGLTRSQALNSLASISVLLLFLCGLWLILRRPKMRIIAAPQLAMVVFLGLAFAYFRYRAASAWGEGSGQTWNQFKISQWASLPAFLIVGTILANFSRRLRWAARSVLFAATAVIAVGLVTGYVKADERTADLRRAAASHTEPFAAYKFLRDAVKRNAGANDVVYLDMTGPEVKSRELVVYFLNDVALASDWRDDGYIWWWISEAKRQSLKSSADWIVSTLMKPEESTTRVLPWYFFKTIRSKTGVELRDVTGGYDREQDQNSWWYWTQKELTFTFTVSPLEGPRPVLKIRTQYTPAKWDTVVTCRVSGNGVDIAENISMTTPGTYESQPFKVEPGPLVIRFSTERAASQFPHDPRPLAFLIRDIDVVPATDTPVIAK